MHTLNNQLFKFAVYKLYIRLWPIGLYIGEYIEFI